MQRLTNPLLLILLGLICGCGGSGGGGVAEGGDDATPPAPLLLGPYGYLEFFARSQGGMFTEAGPAEIDSAGKLTGDGRRYFTSLASPEALSSTSFVLDPVDGALSNFDGGGGLIRLGGLGEGNHLAVLAAGDNLANVVVLTQPSAGAQTSALEGAYHYAFLSPSQGISLWGKTTFDARGTAASAATANGNVNGTITMGAEIFFSAQLQATGDAAVTMEHAGSLFRFEGTVSDGVGLIVSSRVDSDGGGAPMALAMVRAPTDGNNALFQGRYWVVHFNAEEDASSGGLGFGSVRGVIDADGQGTFFIRATVHTGASFSELASPGVYSVGPDGTLSLGLTFASGTWTGGIDALGRHAVLGGDSEGRTPMLGLLVRQP